MNAVVRAGPISDVVSNAQCGSQVTAAQASTRGGTIEFVCDSPLRARYVSVDIPATSPLQLCEVTVEEIPLKQCPRPGNTSIDYGKYFFNIQLVL